MNSSIVKDIKEAYNSVYCNNDNLFEDIVDFCVTNCIFETSDETEYFANLIIENDLAFTFVEDALEYYAEEQLLEESYIAEVSAGLLKAGLKAAGGVLKKVTPAVRGLPAKTLVKKGYTPGGFSGTGKQLGKVNKPALATQTRSIQQARAARKPAEPQKANKYADMLAAKKAAAPAPTTKPAAPKSGGGMTPSYVAKRGVTDTLATTLALGMGHMAGLKPATNVLRQMATPIVKSVGKISQKTAPTVSKAVTSTAKTTPKAPKGAAADPWKQFPKKPTTQRGLPKEGPSSKVPNRTLPGSPTPKALPSAGKTSAPKAPKPTFKPEALPKAQKGAEPAGALVSTRAPKAPKSGLSPEGKAIQRLNKMTGGGPLGTRELPKLSPRAPKPAWGAGATPPKPQQSSGQVQRSVDLPPSKTTSSVKSTKKTPEPPTGKGGNRGGLTSTVRATLSPAEKTGNMKYPGLEKYATGSGPGTGGAKTPKKSVLGPAAAAAGAAAAGASVSQEPSKEKKKTVKTDVYNTMDASGKVRSRKKVGPAKVGTTFEDAFRFNRKKLGPKGTFEYAGKKYTTKMAGESLDNFDFILDFLLNEGYANDEALKIMVNLDQETISKMFSEN